MTDAVDGAKAIDLDALEALRTKATPTPWDRTRPFRDASGIPGCDLRKPDGTLLGWVMDNESDAELIVATVNALPAIITELRALRKQVATLTNLMYAVRPSDGPCPCGQHESDKAHLVDWLGKARAAL
jgi:hypothetical protein